MKKVSIAIVVAIIIFFIWTVLKKETPTIETPDTYARPTPDEQKYQPVPCYDEEGEITQCKG